MKYEIVGFGVWVIVYASMKLASEHWAATDNWFFWGCITGILCAAIVRGTYWLRKDGENV